MGDQCNLYFFIPFLYIGRNWRHHQSLFVSVDKNTAKDLTHILGCLSWTLFPFLSLCSTFRVFKALVIAYVAYSIFI